VNPGITFEVNGSINQKAVINKSASEMMYTPTSQVMGSARSAMSLVVGLL
jgi:CRISPR/Cas system CSM-associated protein Csm3 (group 7 of RAMP superfamily)